jgi:putative addiction module component (TIGR02574 family)
MTKDEIIAEAKKLCWEDRADIVDELILSQSPEERAAVDAAWAAELRRRMEALHRGEVETIDGEEAMKSAYEALGYKRKGRS